MSRLLPVLLTALVLALPASAAAQSGSSPFAPLPQASPQTNTDVTVPAGTVTQQDDSFGTTGYVLLALIGAALIGGISFVVLRDARDHAPSEDRPGLFAGRGEPKGDPEELAVAKKRSDARKRAAAKRARQARKKNRPR